MSLKQEFGQLSKQILRMCTSAERRLDRVIHLFLSIVGRHLWKLISCLIIDSEEN